MRELGETDVCTLVYEYALMGPGLTDERLLRGIELSKIWVWDGCLSTQK